MKNSNKNLKPTYSTDQIKVNHREAVKGHKTLLHFKNMLKQEELEQELLDYLTEKKLDDKKEI